MPLLTTPAIVEGTMSGTGQPTLTQHGVELRPWGPGDADTAVRAYADPDIQRWHARSMTRSEAGDWITSWAKRWLAESGAGWAVMEDGTVAGQISLRRVDLYEGLAELSYWVLPEHRRRAIATRAIRALSAWSLSEFGVHRIELNHSTANPGSCRVAERTGYRLEGTKRSEARHADGWHDMHLHARLAQDSDPPNTSRTSQLDHDNRF